jgi:hypothetical protein
LDQVFAFQSFLLLQIFRMFKIVKLALFQFPSVVAKSVMTREHSAGRGADFLGGFQFALAHSLLERSAEDCGAGGGLR